MELLFEVSKQVHTIFPKENVEVKPKEQKLMVLEAPFKEEITGMGHNKAIRHKRANNPHYENKIH